MFQGLFLRNEEMASKISPVILNSKKTSGTNFVKRLIYIYIYIYLYMLSVYLPIYLSLYISYNWSRAKDVPISDLQTQLVVINQNICRVDSGIIIDIIITENVLGRPIKYCRKKIGPQVKLLQTIALTPFSIQKHLKLLKKI